MGVDVYSKSTPLFYQDYSRNRRIKMETEKKAEPKKSPRFIHFGWYGQTMKSGKKKHNGVLTVAYRQTDGALRIGFVFCSPSDNFSRKEGRNDALRIMRNYPIVMPLRPDKFNRDLILELVNHLCGIGPKGRDWNIPDGAILNHDVTSDKITSRIPGWAKRWWINIAVNGSPMGRHQNPKKYEEMEEMEDPWCSVKCIRHTNYTIPKNVFDIPVSEFFRQAKEAGIDIALI